MKLRRIAVVASAVAVAALVAVGCGRGSGGTTSAGDEELAQTQELVVTIGDEVEAGVFDPPQTSYLDAYNRLTPLFATLYRYDATGSQLVPYLAESLPEVSEDGLVYTVKLRSDAKWSDGRDLTAEDAVFGARHALNPETGAYFASFMLDLVGACEYNAGDDAEENCPEPREDGSADSVGVRAIDDHTVEYRLRKPVPWFDQLLTLQTFVPLREDVVTKHGEDWIKPENMVTSGPFVLTEYERGDRIVMERNEEFWGADDVKLERIVMRVISEPKTALTEFERGDLDLAFPRTAIPAADIDRVKQMDEYVSSPSTETQYVYLNTRNPELSDPKVRQAIAIAIDRPAIVENITKRGDKPMNTVVPSGIPGYDVIAQGAQEFIGAEEGPDVERAKRLLEEGGWDESETLDLYFSSDSGAAPAIAEQIQSDLAEIGVKVRLRPTSGDVLSSKGFGISPVEARVDMILLGWIMDYLDGQDWYQLFTCGNVEAGLNASNFCDEDYDRVYEEALQTVDADARFELYRQLEAMLTGPDGKMPAVPLYQPVNDTLVQRWVKGFELGATGIIYWDDIYITAEKES